MPIPALPSTQLKAELELFPVDPANPAHMKVYFSAQTIVPSELGKQLQHKVACW